MNIIRSAIAVAALAGALSVAGGGHALAQGFNSGGIASQGFQPPVKGGGVVPPSQLPPPPGLPGAAKHESVAPASKLPLDMPPTEALFDAINRGDMTAARDSLSRGADLSAENVLGMTPLELSVDLGRNDITFLLLSLRGGAGERTPALAASAPPPIPGKATAAPTVARQAPASSAYARLAATTRAVRSSVAPPGLAPASVRYAGSDPGTAVPQAGFLGFGAASP